MIDQHQRGRTAPGSTVPAPHSPPAAFAAASQEGGRIAAIRRLRETTGLGLRKAKDVVDSAGRAVQAASGRHAPGEVPRSRTGVWLAAVLVAAAILAYFLFGRAA